jgi:hypothetical protein
MIAYSKRKKQFGPCKTALFEGAFYTGIFHHCDLRYSFAKHITIICFSPNYSFKAKHVFHHVTDCEILLLLWYKSYGVSSSKFSKCTPPP